jgi:hypothetical protein
MIRALIVTLALSAYLALVGDHYDLPADIVWHGGWLLMDEEKEL